MNTFRSRAAASIGALAALAMTATPVLARHGDWRYHRHHRHGDGGDLLAGLLIVGGIAAIASAAGKASKAREADRRDDYPVSPDYGQSADGGYGQVPGEPDEDEVPEGRSDYPDATSQGGFDGAADRCVEELEDGGRRIGSVDSVGRADDLYHVEGRLEDGRDYDCRVEANGRVRSVSVDGRAMI